MSPLIHQKSRLPITVVAPSNKSVLSVGPALGPICFCLFIYLHIFCFESMGLAVSGGLFFAPPNAGFLAAHLSRMAPLLRRFAAYYFFCFANLNRPARACS